MLRPSLSRPLQAKSDTDDVCRIRTLSVDIDSHVNPGEAFTVDPSHRTRQLIGSSHHPVRVIPWNGEPAMSTRLPAVVLVTVGAVVLSALAPMASAASDPSVRSRAQPRPRVVEAAATAVPMHQVGGAMNCAASAGSLLWLCSGRQLLAVDVLDPSQPRVVGRSALLPGILRALTLVEEGSKAWLVAGDFLVGLDLAKPAQPVELGRIDVQQDMAGALKPVMAVGDDGLLLGSWARGIVRLVLIADPRRPMVVASDDIRIPYGTRVLDLAARGDRLYVLEVTEESSRRPGDAPESHGDIAVYALDPAAPPLALYARRLPGEIDTSEGHLAWDGDMLWAQADRSGIWGWRVAGGPEQPLLAGTLAGCRLPASFTVHERRAYASCRTGMGGISGTAVFDLSLPECPLLAKVPYQQGDFVFIDPAIAVAQGVLWLGYSAGELRGLDIDEGSGPPSLRQVASLRLVGTVKRINWDKARRRLLSSDGDGLVAIDVADRDRPRVGPRLAGGFYVSSFEADGDRLALVDGGGADVLMDALELRDLRDPDSAPIILDRQTEYHSLGWNAFDPLRLRGSRLLLARVDENDRSHNEFLSLWDWPPHGRPQEQARWPINCGCVIKALALEGDLAAVYSTVRTPSYLRELSVIDLKTGVRRDLQWWDHDIAYGLADLHFAGGHLWLAFTSRDIDGSRPAVNVTRIDLSDPARLTAANFWHESSNLSWWDPVFLMHVPSQDRLIFGHGGGLVRVFAMKENRLASLTRMQSPAPIEDMDISPDGDRLFLASGEHGLVTIDRPPGGWRREPVR